MANKVLGGWQVGGILTFSDGNPVSVGGIPDFLITGTGSRPDATGISPLVGNPTPDLFWNLAAFSTTNPELQFRHGNVNRNTLLTPGYGNWDASLTKNIRVREGHNLQFRWETFNASNHPNWGIPSTNVLSAAVFGRVTDARTMRQMQFGLKYMF